MSDQFETFHFTHNNHFIDKSFQNITDNQEIQKLQSYYAQYCYTSYISSKCDHSFIISVKFRLDEIFTVATKPCSFFLLNQPSFLLDSGERSSKTKTIGD